MTIRKTLISAATTTALCIGGLSLALPATAQDADPAGEKRENVDYFSMTFVNYKPGKADAASKLIEDHFAKAGKVAGNPPPVTLHFQSGSYDAAFYWKQEGGLSDLEWVTTPADAKWWAAMVAQEGSEKKAQKVWDDYLGTISNSLTVIGHRHTDNDEE